MASVSRHFIKSWLITLELCGRSKLRLGIYFRFKSCFICFFVCLCFFATLVELFLSSFFELHVPDSFYVTFAHQC